MASKGTLDTYTDGLKMTDRVGCGIFIKYPDITLSYRLPGHCSVFKSRGHGNLKVAQCLLSGGIFP